MILKTKGKPINLNDIIVGRINKSGITEENSIVILQDDLCENLQTTSNCLAVITENDYTSNPNLNKPIIHNVKTLQHLEEGDIVLLNTDGVINTLFRINSPHNFMFFTEQCNSNCLMCSQPPKNKDDSKYFYEVNSRLIPLIPKDCSELGITGGEPTLLGDYFYSLLDQLKKHLPNTNLPCLTNGRSFAWQNITDRTVSINNPNLILCIPIYADIPEIHDYVVQAKDAFHQTVLGIYNLARYDIRIELRIVLHKITIPRLLKLAEFIYKNMPFVEHIALMGLEIEGYTPYNIDKLWIDPYEYQDILKDTVYYLYTFGMNISIYNIPLCLLPKELWPFSRKSISDWKNIYHDECSKCAELLNCGGFFKSSIKKSSAYIKAF
ncbi:His-Xaa-Ser system radical SAM maturase HxsC [Chryseobacterium sp. KMC2]|uniref:His-Xaa-Ser system radical SAM maturase HxsC n=1 Tax=Chryseobacterium sp. KMC2 TaxID=2800705 RepID=UPI000645C8A2|nr:His-Xaa-Ser system radical SAM maturase HxsC [Chryseobacterium sp. KMC2]MBL3546666.1 His-Xaa-Ser system radical SAM maturase HxsC [Chryseobacterium sp. KMC2]